MSDKNAFDKVADSLRGNPLAAWVFVLSVLFLMIGVINFFEDTYSSYMGIKLVENLHSVKPASWEYTYWGLSLFFQVASVLSFFIFWADTKKYWYAFWIAIGSQIIDMFADYVYRSGSFMSITTDPPRFMWAFILTMFFTFLGSEVALSVGFGLTKAMLPEGLKQLGLFFGSLIVGFKSFVGGLKNKSYNPPQNRPQNNNNKQQKNNFQSKRMPNGDIEIEVPEELARMFGGR